MTIYSKKKFLFISIFLITLGFFAHIYWMHTTETELNKNTNNQRPLKTSQYEISFVHISSDNWSGYAGQPWFHLGDGTENDPHRIENLTVNPAFHGNAIHIHISSEEFIIQNCTILDGELSYGYAGIRLDGVDNGKVINNTIKNVFDGLFLIDTTNISISDNLIHNCTNNGFWIGYSNNIEIYDNDIFETDWDGILINSDCYCITIEENRIFNNTVGAGAGIQFTGQSDHVNHDNYIYNNTLRDNVYGILLTAHTNSTDIMNNEIFNNILSGVDIRFNCFDNRILLNNFSNTHNALDDSSNNYWDNGTIGNLYDDYISSQGGYDLDDDGIGDIPYKIYNDVAQTINTVNDSFPICDDGDDISPTISVLSPANDTFHSAPPTLTVFIYDAGGIDSQWYNVLNTGETDTFSGTEFQINPTIWNNQSEGIVTIRVFVNDSGNNIDFSDLQIIKDSIDPSVTIDSPSDGIVFSESPEVQVTIFDTNTNETWYTIIGSGQNHAFTGASFEVNSTQWDTHDQGTVIIRVFANDSASNIGYADLTVIKDTINPFLMINSPLGGTKIGATAPTINVTVIELHLDKFWFTINDSSTLHFISAIAGENIFAMESVIWDAIPEGHVLITFFANDTLGHSGTISISIIKELSENPLEPPKIPGYDAFTVLIVSLCSLAISIRIRSRKNNYY